MSNKKIKESLSPIEQIGEYLKENKQFHLNYEPTYDYTVSSGSLMLDLEMGGGLKPSIFRATGISEGGKTSCSLSFAKNFLNTVENSFVFYVKAEGRLSEEMIDRSGIDKDRFFIFKSNIFETVLDAIRGLISDNPKDTRYFFVIDSIDALVPVNDLDKPFTEATKVAGGSVLASNFLKKMALPLTSKGHICTIISQVRSTVKINPYEKADPKMTNANGGNALLHYSDWICEFKQRYARDLIPPNSKEPEGHWCKILFCKSSNEKTGVEVKYPIKYGRTGGKSIWVEYEILNMLKTFDMIKPSRAWITVEKSFIDELSENNFEIPEKVQGEEAFRKLLEDNPDLTKYLFNKFKKILETST